MNRKKIVVIISTLVIVFSVICSVLPLITKNELADKTVISTFGETVLEPDRIRHSGAERNRQFESSRNNH